MSSAPGTRETCQQLPTIQHTVAVFKANGFALTEHRRVDQATAPSLHAFAGRTRFRADTSLALISDSEFLEGQVAIKKTAAHEPVAAPVIERIELSYSETTRLNELFDSAAIGVYHRNLAGSGSGEKRV